MVCDENINVSLGYIELYFNEYILGFMFSDIDKCIKAKANFAVASILMVYTENIGSLINGNLGKRGTGREDFNKFLDYFEYGNDKGYYKNFKIKYKEYDNTYKEVGIYEIFRCGLIHEYSPKVKSSINNDPNGSVRNNYPGIGWSDPGNEMLMFNNNEYYRDFKAAVNKIFEMISRDDDSDIIKNVEKSLNRIQRRELNVEVVGVE